jgi:hypothetical protein
MVVQDHLDEAVVALDDCRELAGFVVDGELLGAPDVALRVRAVLEQLAELIAIPRRRPDRARAFDDEAVDRAGRQW